MIDSLKVNVNLFSVDNFGYIYTANNDVLVKYNYDLDTFFSASLKTFFPTSIEVSKSFRVLLFDKERGIVKFLDNTLTPIDGDINLADLDIMQPAVVCESFNGNAFWVLDGSNMQLLKINNNLEITTRIENLNFLFSGDNPPVHMQEHNDILYIHFKNNGVATFDVFGTFLKFYPLKAKWITSYNNHLVVINQNQLNFLSLPLLDVIKTFKIDDKGYEKCYILNGNVYFQSKRGIYIYKILTK